MSTHTFGYNGLDTRTSKTVGSSTTSYLRNGAYVTDGVLKEVTGSTTTNHTPGISEKRGSSSTQFLHSGLKNADARTSGQSLDATRQYDAFGNEIPAGGSGTWTGPFGYAGGFGYQEDTEAGLKLLGHRYYDSTTGRFLSKDPLRDRRNWSGYAGNNPVGRSDEAGLQQKDIGGRSRLLVPPGPPGVNVRKNAMEARRNGLISVDLPFSWWATDSWFVNKVREGGDWDYKGQGKGLQYEPFGNFHYGVVSAAYGWSEPTALQAAGIAQVAAGNSSPEYGSPWRGPPYGDDPRDQYWIRMGYRYYNEVIRKKPTERAQ